MIDEKTLQEKIEQAVSFARTHKNVIAEKNYKDIMGDLVKEEKISLLIEQYLKEKHIRILRPEDEAKEEEIDFEYDLNEEDKNAIDFYYEEIKNLPHLTEREIERITVKAVSGDKEAQKKLINIYLPQVIELSKLYAGHDVPVEDLIGEGNIALMLAVGTLECLEDTSEVEGYIGKVVIEALEKLVTVEDDEEKLIVKMGEKLKKLNKDEEV